ncbi:MAG: riboflavin synthase [Planctomycetota bacterium]|jgi:riboflavin synthase
MFTGLVETTGEIRRSEPRPGGGRRLWVGAAGLGGDPAIGDSVAVDGCCLTVVESDGGALAFDVIPESLERTALGARSEGDRVNLELPLRPTDRLGGHFVQGHVDAVTELLGREEQGDAVVFRFALPADLRGHVVEKGSITIDGVSLTVAAADAESFSVALIPHTLEITTLGGRNAGDRVNIEGDILAKYVAALLERGRDA